ncbi:hypothetical protein JWR97_15905 [Pseudomonas cedrina subsp. fulgida]|nr:hypothetical protein [Pseudomonas cedrina subsp. fulgida]
MISDKFGLIDAYSLSIGDASEMHALFYAENAGINRSVGKPRGDEEEKPQTWKQPDDGTELSERDQERPLKP